MDKNGSIQAQLSTRVHFKFFLPKNQLLKNLQCFFSPKKLQALAQPQADSEGQCVGQLVPFLGGGAGGSTCFNIFQNIYDTHTKHMQNIKNADNTYRKHPIFVAWLVESSVGKRSKRQRWISILCEAHISVSGCSHGTVGGNLAIDFWTRKGQEGVGAAACCTVVNQCHQAQRFGSRNHGNPKTERSVSWGIEPFSVAICCNGSESGSTIFFPWQWSNGPKAHASDSFWWLLACGLRHAMFRRLLAPRCARAARAGAALLRAAPAPRPNLIELIKSRLGVQTFGSCLGRR